MTAPSSSHRAVGLRRLLPRAGGLGCRRPAAHSPFLVARRRLKTRPLRNASTCASESGGLHPRSTATDCVCLCVSGWGGLCRHPFPAVFSASALLTFLGDGATACSCVHRLDRRRRGDGARNDVYDDGRDPCPMTVLVSSLGYKPCMADRSTCLGAMRSVATATPVAFLVFPLLALRQLFFKVRESHCRDGFYVMSMLVERRVRSRWSESKSFAIWSYGTLTSRIASAAAPPKKLRPRLAGPHSLLPSRSLLEP
jgi:hypothetical protein